MKQYIGTKVVHAAPAIKATGLNKACKVANQVLTADQIKECEANGWHFTDKMEGYTVRYADDYESWCPKAAFDEAYRLTDAMNFGLAIEAAKMGKKIARAGWNGKKQYVELATCISYKNSAGKIVNVDHQNIGNKALAFVGTSGVQMGWLASQADMLADDWYIVE